MPSKTIYLDLDEKSRAFAAIAYLAILAYPGNSKQGNKFIDACSAYVCKQELGSLNRNVITSHRILKFSENRKVDTTVNAGWKIIDDQRLEAGYIANWMIVDSIVPVKMKNGKRFTPTGYFQNLHPPDLETGGIHTSKDAFTRRWTRSREVLHLAIALNATLKSVDCNYNSLDDLLFNPNWVLPAVINAEKYRLSIINGSLSRVFKVLDGSMLQLLPK